MSVPPGKLALPELATPFHTRGSRAIDAPIIVCVPEPALRRKRNAESVQGAMPAAPP